MKVIKVEKCEECPHFAYITTNDYGLLAKCKKDGRTYLVALDTTIMPFCPLTDEEGGKA